MMENINRGRPKTREGVGRVAEVIRGIHPPPFTGLKSDYCLLLL